MSSAFSEIRDIHRPAAVDDGLEVGEIRAGNRASPMSRVTMVGAAKKLTPVQWPSEGGDLRGIEVPALRQRLLAALAICGSA